ncbi:TetR/AcrR family transcriptional regulator [Pseudonocardia halophobica]|uniref:TetR family transcriptional regulator n=1 Tax=Pseudonocardia halophobica TaxID=29401 RepID=A0A9W6L480_9PSEU|nr:TetR family transcriptional regulator [Pseudonocardia halophobica]
MVCGVTLRADAERNRRALVAAARAVFGEQGLQAPIDEIARRAGVGNATLYRRFPSRRALVAAVFAERLADFARAAEEALAEPDPWTGFRAYVLTVLRMQAADRGLADLLTLSVPAEPELEALRGRVEAGLAELVDRAQRSGDLRADVTPEDLPLLLMANAGLVHRTAEAAPHAWERLAAFLLDGLRAPAASAPAPPGPSREALARSMRAGAARLGCVE